MTPEQMAIVAFPLRARGRSSKLRDGLRAAFVMGARAALERDAGRCPDCEDGAEESGEYCALCEHATMVPCTTCRGTGRRQ